MSHKLMDKNSIVKSVEVYCMSNILIKKFPLCVSYTLLEPYNQIGGTNQQFISSKTKKK